MQAFLVNNLNLISVFLPNYVLIFQIFTNYFSFIFWLKIFYLLRILSKYEDLKYIGLPLDLATDKF